VSGGTEKLTLGFLRRVTDGWPDDMVIEVALTTETYRTKIRIREDYSVDPEKKVITLYGMPL
jgi:hypothetical protein